MSDETVTIPIDETADATASTPIPRPRIRWGAITWGLIVTGIAIVVPSVAGSAQGRGSMADFLGDLTFGSASLILVLALGVTVLLLGLLAVIRRAQRPAHPPVG